MDFEPIAIVGRSCIFPGASTPERLWNLVSSGQSAISNCPQQRWRVPQETILSTERQPGRAPTLRGGYVSNFVSQFDPRGFAINPAEIQRHDELVQWVLHAAREALHDAGIGQAPARTGAIFGLLCLPTEKFASFVESFWLGEHEDAIARFGSGLAANLLAQALRLDQGAFALDAACASSLYAIQLACAELQSGRADIMLAGAVSRADDLLLHVGFSALEALSPSGQSRPFHKHADGLLPAEGASFVALKRLSDAVRLGDAIHGVIRGIGISNDGRSASLMTPSERGQEAAMHAAYRMARVEPAEISLLECHATGTQIGDACELRSTARIFDGLNGVPVGSVKSNLGHPMTAAGMAGLMKLLGALSATTRPATLHAANRGEQTALLDSSPFRLLSGNEYWQADSPRKTALSAFGFGGNNAHLILEEWSGQLNASTIHPAPTLPSPIAIVSMGIIAGDCENVNQFTQAWFGKLPGRRRTESIELELDGLGFPPADLERSLAQQVMALAAASQALSGLGEIPTERTGVYTVLDCQPEAALLGLGSRLAPGAPTPPADSNLPSWTAAAVIGGLANITANRISSRFDLRGPSFAVIGDGLAAVRAAADALSAKTIDLALAGAVDLSCEPVHEAAAAQVLPSQQQASGDAAVFFAMKRLTDAEASNDRIYAIYDPEDREPAGPASSTVDRFGYPHAAGAMLDAAAAVLECAHSARAPKRPWIAPAKSRRLEVAGAVFASHPSRAPLPLIMDPVAALDIRRKTPVKGELALVFPGAAAAYHGSGRSLLMAFPEVVQEVVGRAPEFASVASWIFEDNPRAALPQEKLAAHTLLCQVHAKLTLDWLNLKPHAAIGFSAGETNALLAFQVWRDADRFFTEFNASGVFSKHLSGDFAATNGSAWETWVVFTAYDRLRVVLEQTPGVRLLAIHAPGEYLIAGPSVACGKVLSLLDKRNAQRIDFDMVVHCPDLQPFAGTWRSLHHRETFPPADGPRFYQLATGQSYTLSRDAIAEALTAQALQTLDFPRAIEQAWNDGVRVFLEHGPRGTCTSWIRKILGDREHLAIALDLPGVDSLTQLMNAAAELSRAGVELDLGKITERIGAKPPNPPRRSFRLPAHRLPVSIPKPRQSASPNTAYEQSVKHLTEEHLRYLDISTTMHQEFLATSQRALQHFLAGGTPTAAAVVPVKLPSANVVFTRTQLELSASGQISQVYGREFQELDSFRRVCRLPMPPLLLVDRVIKLDAEPRSMKLGLIHTETDVRRDSWFLQQDRIPAGLMIEGGQADMLLISWLGIDFHVRGERVYRMLGCDVRFHGPLARSGETLRYEIQITGHARQGDARIFFFQYDCFSGDRLAISVRNGQAGFFSDDELRGSAGVLWSPEMERSTGNRPVPRIPNIAFQFDAAQISAAAEGRIFDCFREGFEFAAAQQRPPIFARPELMMFDTVTNLDFAGGPWQRGFCRAEYAIRPDSWLFTSHFKDDPCLPGTIMLEGCLQLMAFYMMALGLTIRRDGWRFEPVTDETFELRCRGQVTPDSRILFCDLFVDDFIDGPEPVLYAHVLGTVDGVKAFHGRRIGLKLVPGNPLDAPCPQLEQWPGERKAVAHVNGIPLDYRALLACAWGLPSSAFGQPYARFDLHERCPRLPGPPYHCITRITRVDGEFGVERTGSTVEAEFDLEPAAWYFEENGMEGMPFSMLIEAGLQPCGWLSCFVGIPLRFAQELYFRNLDGSVRMHRTVPAGNGVITTRARLTNIARQGTVTLVSFDVQMSLNAEPLLEMKTGFGFFTKEDLARQAGLPPNDEEAALFSKPSNLDTIPRLATGKLMMIDRITGLWPESDGSLRGRIRAIRDVRPSDWYFKAHFYQDPVQPGSLGLEALVQTLQFYAIHQGMGGEFEQPRYENALHSTWRYRGQVTPLNKKIETEVRVHQVEKSLTGYALTAEGWLWADGVRIYHMPQFGLIVSEGARL